MNSEDEDDIPLSHVAKRRKKASFPIKTVADSPTATTRRRRQRTTQSVKSYAEDDDTDEDDDDSDKDTKPRAALKHSRPVKKELSDIEEESVDVSTNKEIVSEDDDVDLKPERKLRRAKKRETESTPADRQCPHCNKVLSSLRGLSYHLEHKVCQKVDKNPDRRVNKAVSRPTRTRSPKKRRVAINVEEGSPQKQQVASDSEASNKEDSSEFEDDDDVIDLKPRKLGRPRRDGKRRKRSKGPKSERTCPHCKKEFSIITGLSYHLEHKVCQRETSNRFRKGGRGTVGSKPFRLLEPGALFVTKFGVARVVKDSRAPPDHGKTAVPEDAAKEARRIARVQQRITEKSGKRMFLVSKRSRKVRERLNGLYMKNRLTQNNIWNIYFGRTPQRTDRKRSPQEKCDDKDPYVPRDSYPNRIVECVLVKDERQVITDLDQPYAGYKSDAARSCVAAEYKENKTERVSGEDMGIKLFLERRLLIQLYNRDLPVYICKKCGRIFQSFVGFKSHITEDICTKRKKQQEVKKQDALKKKETQLSIEAKAKKKLAKGKFGMYLGQCGVYPEVLKSLGFKWPSVSSRRSVKEAAEEKVNPDEVLERLRKELNIKHISDLQQVRKKRPHEVPVYIKVWKALKFKRPRPKQQLKLTFGIYNNVWKNLGFRAPKKQRKKGRLAVKRLKKGSPADKGKAAVIVDMMVLAEEVHKGRYPSMKKYTGDHADLCAICNDGGVLYCCEFCPNAVHIECVRTKHVIRDPEPEDDFMCHRCIGYVISQRLRAEKRRLEKRNKALGIESAIKIKKRRRKGAGEETEPKETSETKGKDDDYSLPKCPLGGPGGLLCCSSCAATFVTGLLPNENTDPNLMNVASAGRESSELVELLRDAQNRLRQITHVSTVSDIRRSLLDPSDVDISQYLVAPDNANNTNVVDQQSAIFTQPLDTYTPGNEISLSSIPGQEM